MHINKNKIQSFFVAISFTIAVIGCAKTADSTDTSSTDSTTPAVTPKALASVWTVSNSAWSINLTNARTDNVAFTMTLTMANGTSQCSCGLTLNGTDSAGTCTLSTNCTSTAGVDPGCASNGGNGFGMCAGGSYTNDGTHFVYSSGATYH